MWQKWSPRGRQKGAEISGRGYVQGLGGSWFSATPCYQAYWHCFLFSLTCPDICLTTLFLHFYPFHIFLINVFLLLLCACFYFLCFYAIVILCVVWHLNKMGIKLKAEVGLHPQPLKKCRPCKADSSFSCIL